eukprot:2511840-Karenia_brevis.AAC.1
MEDAESKGQLSQWMDAFGDTLMHFETNSLRKHCGCFSRWQKWLALHPKISCSPAEPTDVAMAAYLRDQTSAGPAAAMGSFASFQWLQSYLGFVKIPLGSPIV